MTMKSSRNNEEKFSLFFIEMKLITCHPSQKITNAILNLRDGFIHFRNVGRRIDLSVVSITLV